ncbi:CynX/NimT family MFS transporter [Cohnella sp. GCM10027633]|uniref:CynX/NimT family MFS transporter n=1 Tax=unclassified Cohnella TaxID=2636738 RepID=UPI00363EEC60
MTSGKKTGLIVVGILLVSVNLRAPLTSVSPVLGSISEAFGLSHAVAGLLTTLPLLAFALFSVLAPTFGRRFGLERVFLGALLCVSAGLLARPWSGAWLLLLGTALAGIGIAACNVLLPAFIKRSFPLRLGLMTGVYSVTMNLLGSVASGASVPVSRAFGVTWEWTLAWWGFVALLSAIYWAIWMRGTSGKTGVVAGEPSRERTSLWRYRLSWQMTLYMGLQSFLFFVVMAWLPDIAAERGVDARSAGFMVALMQFGGLPFNMAMPLLAGKVKDQRLLTSATALIFALGTGCMFMYDAGMLALGAALIGIGGGSSFGLAIMFFSLRTHGAQQAAEMSGMAQSFGYLLASAGPALFGWLHDASGNWDVPLSLLGIAVLVFAWAGLGAGRDAKLPVPDTVREIKVEVV